MAQKKTRHEILTAHQMAVKLLQGPDVAVLINGWGSGEGFTMAVTDLRVTDRQYYIDEPRTEETWDQVSRSGPAICLDHNPSYE